MIRRTTAWALRALIYLSGDAAGRFVLMPEIAKAIGASPGSTHQILLRLGAKGLIISQRGRGGGYMAVPRVTALTPADVLRAMDDSLDWPGVGGTEAAASAPISDLLAGLRADALKRLGETTIGDLISGTTGTPFS